MSYFKNVQKGDVVVSLSFGIGKVIHSQYPHDSTPLMEVEFRYRKGPISYLYTLDGILYPDGIYPSLFYGDKYPSIDIPSEPTREPDLEMDSPILVRRHGSPMWYPRHFSHWSKGHLYCWSGGRTSFTSTSIKHLYGVWDQWKLPEEQEQSV